MFATRLFLRHGVAFSQCGGGRRMTALMHPHHRSFVGGDGSKKRTSKIGKGTKKLGGRRKSAKGLDKQQKKGKKTTGKGN